MFMVKASVDQETCIGCVACVSICPEAFEMNEDGSKAQVKPNNAPESTLKEAETVCPSDSIKVS